MALLSLEDRIVLITVDNSIVKQGCLLNNSGWVTIRPHSLTGENEWVTGVIEFTPQTNISSIGIGLMASTIILLLSFIRVYNSGSMYFMNKLYPGN